MKKVDKIFLIVHTLLLSVCIFFLASCTPQMRMQKLIKKHPELIATSFDTSTIYIKDSVLVSIPFRDTIVSYTDSIILKDSISTTTLYKYSNGRERIKTIYKPFNVYFKDTIKTTIRVNHTLKVGATKDDIKKYRLQGRNQAVTIFFIVVILLVVIYFLFKYFKPFKLI